MDTAAVFDALDKVVAETPLGASSSYAAAPLSPTQAVALEAATPDVPASPTQTSFAAAAHAAGIVAFPVEVPRRPEEAPAPPIVAAAPLYKDAPAVQRIDSQPKNINVPPPASSKRPNVILWSMIVVSLIAVTQAIFLIRGTGVGQSTAVAAAPSTGTVSVQSTPVGASLLVNGQLRGVTPITLTLSPGDYTLEVKSGALAQTLPTVVAAGSSINQHIVFGNAPVAASASGGIQITSQPAGVRVSIDGHAAGVTPLTVSRLAPGTYAVVLDGPAGASRQTVNVLAGTVSSLAVTMPTGGASAGWVSVSAPFDVQLFENGALIGTSQTQRIMLPEGRHVIEAVNAGLGYQSSQTVQISPGRVAAIQLEVPLAILNINATPWADVIVDGRTLGTTPLGNVSVPIGTHDIVFRHPQLGERRLATVVTLKETNRVSVNMNQR